MPKFSLEVVLRIVSHMDHYTVIAFLCALPQYTRYAVLVTDHEQCPLFFSIPTISRRYLPLNVSTVRYNSSLRERQIKNHELFTQEIAKTYPIRLYEIDDQYSFRASRRADFSLAHRPAALDKFFPLNPERNENEAELPLDPWTDNPGFNATSFVFLHVRVYPGSPYSLTGLNGLGDRIHSVTGAKCHVGSATCPPEIQVSAQRHIRGSRSTMPQSPVFSAVSLHPSYFINHTLVSVRLENVPVIAYLDLAHIIDLVLVYNDGSVHVPVIEGLVAPNVRRFVIHYDRQVPLFKTMGRLTTRMFGWEKKNQRLRRPPRDHSVSRAFELCHIDSVGAAGCGDRSRDPSQVEPRSLADMSFTFLKRFHCVVLSGVPWHVAAQIAMKAVHHTTVLDLELTHTARPGTDTVIEIPNLKKLIITLKADNLTLPVFRTPILKELYVRIMALNPNLEGLWRQRCAHQEEFSSPGLTYLEVHSLPGLFARAEVTGNRMYTVTEAERTAMEDMIFHHSLYARHNSVHKSLILKGFQ